MDKTFTYNIDWTVPQLNLRMKFVKDKWHELTQDAIIEGFKPFLFEHSDITKSSTLISVSAYKLTPLLVRILYFLSHRDSYSFLSRWRWGTR